MKIIKIISLAIFFLLSTSSLFSQNSYSLTFTDQQLLKSPDSVLIINTSNNHEKILIKGNDTLLLSIETKIKENKFIFSELLVYPNPSNQAINFILNSPTEQLINICIIDLYGKPLITNNYNLESGKYKFKIDGLGEGCYILSVRSKNYNISQKIISKLKQINQPEIKFQEQLSQILEHNGFKSGKNNIDFQYSAGDKLNVTAYLGLKQQTFESIVIDKDTTLNFDFIANVNNDSYPSRLYKLDSIEYNNLCSEAPFTIDQYGLFAYQGGGIPTGDSDLTESEALSVAINTLVKNSQFSNINSSEDLILEYIKGSGSTHNSHWNIGFENQIYSGIEILKSSIGMRLFNEVVYLNGHHYKNIFIPQYDSLFIDEIKAKLIGKALQYYGMSELEEFTITEESINDNVNTAIFWFEKSNYKEFRLIWNIPISMVEYNYPEMCDFYVYLDAITGEFLGYIPTFICK